MSFYHPVHVLRRFTDYTCGNIRKHIYIFSSSSILPFKPLKVIIRGKHGGGYCPCHPVSTALQ